MESRRAVTDHGLADGRFNLCLRFADVMTKLVGTLAVHILMSITVTGHFVVLGRERPHQAGVRRGDFSQHEERRTRAVAAQHVEQRSMLRSTRLSMPLRAMGSRHGEKWRRGSTLQRQR